MNFFEAQERARTQTSLLVVLFVAAIVALTALTTILVVMFLYLQSEIEKPIDKALVGVWSHFSWTLTGAIALGMRRTCRWMSCRSKCSGTMAAHHVPITGRF